MERKLNAPYSKQKWSSQPELLTSMATLVDTDRELYILSTLSGINFDFDVFKIIVDLLRLNVNPNTLLDVLRKIANQSSTFNSDIANQVSSTLLKEPTNHSSSSVSLSKELSSTSLKNGRSAACSSSSGAKKVIKKRPVSEILFSRDSEVESRRDVTSVGSYQSSGIGSGSNSSGVGSSLSGGDTYSTMLNYSSFLADLKDKKEPRQTRSISDM